MRIAIASDHAGFDQKSALVPFLEGLGHEVVDLGPETGGRFDSLEENEKILKVFLVAEFEGGRHAQRVAKIMRLDLTGKREEVPAPQVTPLRSTLAESINAALDAKLGPVDAAPEA